MTRLAIIAILGAAILGALAWAVADIRGAYAGRAALTEQVATLENAVKDKDAAIEHALAERDLARTEAAIEIARMHGEIAARERIATEARARADRISRELNHANATIRDLSARSEYAACLALPLPGGVLDRPAEAMPTAEVDGYAPAAAGGVPGSASGASHPVTVGDALILAPHLQAAFRSCESDKAALRDWVASARGSP